MERNIYICKRAIELVDRHQRERGRERRDWQQNTTDIELQSPTEVCSFGSDDRWKIENRQSAFLRIQLQILIHFDLHIQDHKMRYNLRMQLYNFIRSKRFCVHSGGSFHFNFAPDNTSPHLLHKCFSRKLFFRETFE